jgi:hypothetical protein
VRGDSASSYTWTPPTRGSYRLPPWIVTTFDALHLVRLRGELDPGDRIAVGAARREAAIPGQAELGLRQVRTGGDQLDTTTRPYRVGDPVRRVHWPVSARQGRLMVRPPLQESDGSRLVLVDRAQHHYSGAATQVARADGPAAASSTDFDAVISTAAFCLETLRSSPAVGSARLAYFPPVPASAGPPVSDEVSLACAAPEASVPRGTADAAATGATLTTGPDAAPAGGSGHTLLLTGLPGPEASAWPRGLHGSVTVLLHPAGHDQRPDADVTAAWERAGWSWHVLPPEGAS